MVPVIVEVTVRLEIVAPNAPAAAQVVTAAISRAVELSSNPVLRGGKWVVIAAEKPS